MLKADTIRIVSPLECIYDINKQLFISNETKDTNGQIFWKTFMINNKIRIPKVLGLNFQSIIINESKKTVVMEFSSKILKERYKELININNIEYVISSINKTGIFNINTNLLIDRAEVLILHTANNIEVDKEPLDYITDFYLLKHNQKYNLKIYETGMVFESNKYSGNSDYMKIYCKFAELNRKENYELRKVIDVKQFDKIIKVESEFRKRKKILSNFGSLKLIDILNSGKSPNFDIFERISNINLNCLKIGTETNRIINSGKALNQIEKQAGKKEICKYFNFDQKSIKKIFISRFKGNKCREFKEYINICNSELTKNYSHDNIQRSITEFRKKLIL